MFSGAATVCHTGSCVGKRRRWRGSLSVILTLISICGRCSVIRQRSTRSVGPVDDGVFATFALARGTSLFVWHRLTRVSLACNLHLPSLCFACGSTSLLVCTPDVTTEVSRVGLGRSTAGNVLCAWRREGVDQL